MINSGGDKSESPLNLPEPSPVPSPLEGSLTPAEVHSPYGMAVAASPLPPALAAAPDAKSLLRALKRHWLLAATLGILAAVAASTATWYFMPSSYVADALVRINPTKLFKLDPNDPSINTPYDLQTMAQLVKSRWFVNAALKRPDVAQLRSVRGQFDQVDWLQRKLQTGFISSELLSVSLSGDEPQELVILLNGVIDAYEAEMVKTEQMARKKRIDNLEYILGRYKGFLDIKKKDYRNQVTLLGAANLFTIALQQQYEQRRLDDLQNEKKELERSLFKEEHAISRHDKTKGASSLNPYIPKTQVERALHEESAVRTQQAIIDRLQDDLRAAELVYKSRDNARLTTLRQTIVDAQKQLEAIKVKLRPAIEKALAEELKLKTQDDIVSAKDNIEYTRLYLKSLDEQSKILADRIEKRPTDSLDLEDSQGDLQTEQSIVGKLKLMIEHLRAETTIQGDSVTIQDRAAAHEEKNLKKQIMMSGAAGAGAMGLVFLIIAYLEFRARRINTGDDVVYGLGWRLVGSLPALPNGARSGLLRRRTDDGYWHSLMTESVDATRTLLLHAARAEAIRTIMVTSAVSGEGKTSLSCHLATSLARAGRRTLLLDCDLRNPSAHRLFELPADPGFCEVLRGQAELGDVIRATPANNLWMIPAGQFDEQTLQSLAQGGIVPILERLKSQFDFILVDSSPVLPVADSLVIGQHVDVVVFSLLRDVSRIPNVYAAYQRLATLGIRILGAVVNGVETGAYGYSHQYYAKQAN